MVLGQIPINSSWLEMMTYETHAVGKLKQAQTNDVFKYLPKIVRLIPRSYVPILVLVTYLQATYIICIHIY